MKNQKEAYLKLLKEIKAKNRFSDSELIEFVSKRLNEIRTFDMPFLNQLFATSEEDWINLIAEKNRITKNNELSFYAGFIEFIKNSNADKSHFKVLRQDIENSVFLSETEKALLQKWLYNYLYPITTTK